MPIVLRCHPGIGPAVEGIALVAQDNFSARYDLDRKTGVFSRPSHALAGQSYDGGILVLNDAKGGVATAWMLHEMKSRGIGRWRWCSTGSTRSSRKARRSGA
jgi:predicted aconitase with swiveling domain